MNGLMGDDMFRGYLSFFGCISDVFNVVGEWLFFV